MLCCSKKIIKIIFLCLKKSVPRKKCVPHKKNVFRECFFLLKAQRTCVPLFHDFFGEL